MTTATLAPAPADQHREQKRKGTYRLLAGLHKTGDRIYGPGELIESELDLLAFNGRGVSPKYQLVHGEEDGRVEARISPDSRIFDPSKETIDQFYARVKGDQAHAATHGFAEAAKQGFDTVHEQNKPAPKPLEQWTKEELVEAANAEEIDLKGAKTVAEMVKVLKAAGVGR